MPDDNSSDKPRSGDYNAGQLARAEGRISLRPWASTHSDESNADWDQDTTTNNSGKLAKQAKK
jgi:hypothetical protein